MLMLFEFLIGLVAIMMARRPKRQFRRRGGRRKMGRYIKGVCDEELDIGTLAARTLVSVLFDQTVEEKAYCSSVKATYSIDDYTPASGDGPLRIGLAHSDYTDVEIEEWIESTTSWKEGDLVQSREVGRRFIRDVGVFQTPSGASSNFVLNDGKPITTKCGWMLVTGQTMRLWAYNQGASAFATTDPNLHMAGHANLWPR